jgi:hypothetical protein
VQFAFAQAAFDGVLVSETGLIDENIDAAGFEVDVAGGEVRALAVNRVKASESRRHGNEQKKEPGDILGLHATFLASQRQEMTGQKPVPAFEMLTAGRSAEKLKLDYLSFRPGRARGGAP